MGHRLATPGELALGHRATDPRLGENICGVVSIAARLSAGDLHYCGGRRSSIGLFRTAQTTLSCFVPTPGFPCMP